LFGTLLQNAQDLYRNQNNNDDFKKVALLAVDFIAVDLIHFE